MKFSFYKEFDGGDWPIKDGMLFITSIHANGDDLESLLENATIGLETSRGNEGPTWSAGDLPAGAYDEVVQMFGEFIGSQTHEMNKNRRVFQGTVNPIESRS